MGLHFIKKSIGLAALIILQSCSGSGGGSSLAIGDPNAPGTINTATKPNCVLGTGGNVAVSGQLKYKRVMQNNSGSLDYGNIVDMPIRGATVQLICGTAVVATTVSDKVDGSYAFSVASGSKKLFIRVRAELKQIGKLPGWDFTVVDNTHQQALYVMDSAVFDTLQTSINNKNLLADSGFNNNLSTPAYSSDRVAAPFAILDSVFIAKEKILTVDSKAQFPALKLNWSVNNSTVEGNVAAGDISSSFFGQPSGISSPQIYILGDDDSDTDEYDEHVIIHEWGHYIEHFFSRSDTIGGSHGGGDKLDMRVAFGEGFGNAFSGIVTDDSIYRDSQGASQAFGFSIDVDNNDCRESAFVNSPKNNGFYSECSVEAILYDLYDSGIESGDTVALGLKPLFDVLTNEQKNTDALTSIFSFITPLKLNNPSSRTSIDTLVSAQSIQTITDIYGDSEVGSKNNPGKTNILPVFAKINLGGAAVNVCSTSENRSSDQKINGNKLGVNRYLRFSLAASQSVTVSATRTSGVLNADPDIEVYRSGVIQGTGDSPTANFEKVSMSNLTAGEYIIVVYEFSYFKDTISPAITCFNVAVSVSN